MLSEKLHRNIFVFSACLLSFAMLLGNWPTNVAEALLVLNWLLEGNFKWKFAQMRNQKVLIAFVLIYPMHLFGLFYSQNFQAGFTDIQIKLPMLVIPAIFFTSKPLSKHEFNAILYSFLLGCFMNTAWCLAYNFLLQGAEAVRKASRFMSHIRLGLFVDVALVICTWFVYNASKPVVKLLFVVLLLYFVGVLFMLGLASGLVYFVILLLGGFCILFFKQGLKVKLSLLLLSLLIIVVSINYVSHIVVQQLRPSNSVNNTLKKLTASGGTYLHFDTLGQKENGNYIYINIELRELMSEWNRVCPEDSFNYHQNYNIQRYEALLRYLASKGWNKDSVAVSRLSQNDILLIQKGVSNYQYPEWSFLHKRVYELVNEYDDFKNTRHINGNSLTMRFYFWKTALRVIKQNLVFGVGTGDVQDELNKVYAKDSGLLEKEWYKRPHNQFLSIAVAFGMIGFLVFIFGIVYPVWYLRKYFSPIFWPFLLIALLSFFTEDTLETMAGMSFYAILNAVFLSQAWFKRQQNPAG